MEGDARQAEQRVAGVDRLGHTVDRPQRGAVATFRVAVLDVVVDQREVVAELDRGGPRERALVLAGDTRVREEPQERSHALAAGRAGAVEGQVIANHLVQTVGGRVPVLHEAHDLGLGVGDEGGEVDVRDGSRHRGAVYTKRVPRW